MHAHGPGCRAHGYVVPAGALDPIADSADGAARGRRPAYPQELPELVRSCDPREPHG